MERKAVLDLQTHPRTIAQADSKINPLVTIAMERRFAWDPWLLIVGWAVTPLQRLWTPGEAARVTFAGRELVLAAAIDV